MTKKGGTPSPCISVCTIDEDSGFCRGCLRTADEIERWLSYTEEQKRDLVQQLQTRKSDMNQY